MTDTITIRSSHGELEVSLETGGVISSTRHGTTSDADVNVTNEAGALISGRNGSGVGSDGTGTVVNHGTIRGAYNGVAINGELGTPRPGEPFSWLATIACLGNGLLYLVRLVWVNGLSGLLEGAPFGLEGGGDAVSASRCSSSCISAFMSSSGRSASLASANTVRPACARPSCGR
jgi:hypothetical protein